MSRVQQILEQLRNEVRLLGSASERSALIALKQVEIELTGVLEKWLRTVPENGKIRTVDYRRLSRALNIIDPSLKVLEEELGHILQKNVVESRRLAQKHNLAEALMLSEAFDEGIIMPPPSRKIETSAALMTAYALWGKRTSRYIKAWTRRKTMPLIGQNKEDFAQRLQKLIPAKIRPASGIVNPGSVLMLSAVSKTRRIITTESFKAYNKEKVHGIKQLGKQDENIMKRWDASLDGVCVICRRLDEELVPVDALFSIGIEEPPAHPYCRCTATIWKQSWKYPKI